MRINSIRLFEVGPFVDTTIDFAPGTAPELADVYLLVGENGAGKSTVLRAIAELIGRDPPLTKAEPISIYKTPESFVHFTTSHGEMRGKRKHLRKVNGQTPLGRHSPPTLIDLENRFFDEAVAFNIQNPTPFAWAAFAFGGEVGEYRARVQTISEDTSSPFDGILSFGHTNNAQRLAQFVANQKHRLLKAEKAKDKARVDTLSQSLVQIEHTISEILGLNFTFHESVEDNNIRIKIDNDILEFETLPDGVKSIMSWLGDLYLRMERIPWVNNTPIEQRSFLLLLDEIDIHLHPRWQRRILPVIQKLFPNAQIIASTHSPFVVASLKDGAVIELKRGEKGGIVTRTRTPEELKLSYTATLAEVFGIGFDFPIEVEEKFKQFQAVRDNFQKGDKSLMAQLEEKAQELAQYGEEIERMVAYEMRQLKQ